MEFWFNNSSVKVKWNNSLSESLKVTSGVRQGGVLSPLLFSAYIDILLSKLESSKIGCFVKGRCLNSFLYADDLLLISISVSDLTRLIGICHSTLQELDLEINFSKSNCMRVGLRFKFMPPPVQVNLCCISWVQEINYLGVHFHSDRKSVV